MRSSVVDITSCVYTKIRGEVNILPLFFSISKNNIFGVNFLFQEANSLPTAQTCFFQLRLPSYSSPETLAERLRYAINNCRSIDLDNYMLIRNAVEEDVDDDEEF